MCVKWGEGIPILITWLMLMIICPRNRRIKLIYDNEVGRVHWKRKTSTMLRIIDLYQDSSSNRRSVRIVRILYGKHFSHLFLYLGTNIFFFFLLCMTVLFWIVYINKLPMEFSFLLTQIFDQLIYISVMYPHWWILKLGVDLKPLAFTRWRRKI